MVDESKIPLMVRTLTCLAAGFLFLPMTVSAQLNQRFIDYSRGAEPELKTVNEAVQGEAIYTDFETATHKAARLLGPVYASMRSRPLFEQGEVVYRDDAKHERYCKRDGGAFRCLVVKEGDLFTHRYTIAKDAVAGTRSKLHKPVSFERVQVPLTGEQASDLGYRLYRKEIVYQGAAGGVLRLMYREFGNDYARPAFSQELTYDIGNEPLTVSVKGVKIEVLEAGNAGINYRILAGFQ